MGIINATNGATLTRRLELGRAFEEFTLADDALIARKVLPPVIVPKKNGTFPSITRGALLQPVNVKRAPRANVSRTDVKVTDKTFTCSERAHEVPVDDTERENYMNEMDADLAATRQAAMKIVLDAEIDTAAAVFNTTTWTGSSLYTDISTVWSDAAATILSDVLAAKEKVRLGTGMRPNALILDEAVFNYLRKNTELKAMIGYVRVPTWDEFSGEVARIFGLDKIIIAGTPKNTANDGAAASLGAIWSNSYAMVARVATTNDLAEPCIGRTMIWSAYGTEGDTNTIVEQYREEQKQSDIIRAKQYTGEFILDASFGHLLKID